MTVRRVLLAAVAAFLATLAVLVPAGRAEAFLPSAVPAPVIPPFLSDLSVTYQGLTVGVSGAVTAAGAAVAGVAAPTTGAVLGAGALLGGAALGVGWGLNEAVEWAFCGGSSCLGDDPDPDPPAPLTAGRLTWSKDYPAHSISGISRTGSLDTWTIARTGSGLTYTTPWVRTCYRGEAVGTVHGASGYLSGSFAAGASASVTVDGCGTGTARIWIGYNGLAWTGVTEGQSSGGWEGYQAASGGTLGVPRRVAATGTCRNGATGATSTVTSYSATYNAQGTTGELRSSGPRPAMPAVACPPGARLTGLQVVREAADGSEIIPRRGLVDWRVPASEVDPAHPNAACLANAAAPCVLEVYKRVGPDWRRCSDPDVSCVGWSTSVSRDTEYQCRWGPYVLDLRQCSPLVNAYQPDGSTRVETQPQPDLDERADPAGQNLGVGLTGLAATAATKAPFSVGPALVRWVGVHLPAEGSGLCWKVEPDLSDPSPAKRWKRGNHAVVDSCTPSGVTAQIMSYRPVLTVLMHGLWAIPLLWWAWRQYAPGSQGNA